MSLGTINLIFNILSVLATGGMLGIVLRYRQAMRGLEIKDKADVRDHYAEELERVVERQRACEQREEALRRRVVELESDILGLINIIRQASADKVLLLDGETSMIIQDMAERIKTQHALAHHHHER